MKTHCHLLTAAMFVSLWLGLAGPASGFYDPTVQRWISRDPIGEGGGINLYGFVHNAPGAAIDPAGQSPVIVVGGGGNVVIIVGGAAISLAACYATPVCRRALEDLG